MKANHNWSFIITCFSIVVYQVKDTIFWKQITTVFSLVLFCLLLFIKSKIQFFESKSQLLPFRCCKVFCCLSSQRYNFLKANHNSTFLAVSVIAVVYQVKDTIFWKQITTNRIAIRSLSALFIKSKIQFFESKSQLASFSTEWELGCLSSQRYNFLKANHNKTLENHTYVKLFIKSKIQFFESKSQPVSHRCTLSFVVYQVKDTIFWKQITTCIYLFGQIIRLFIKSKIQFFESKSQPINCSSILNPVVYQVKDTIFWKQITT